MSDSNNGQTLGGGSGSGGNTPSSWARPSNSAPRIGRIGDWSSGGNNTSSGGPRIGTLRDMASSGGGTPRPDSEDDSGSDRDAGETWFAGGERSGISIQNPDRGRRSGADLMKDLLKQAEEEGRSGSPSGSGSRTHSAFRGSGMTLGGEGTESRVVEDPNAPKEDEEEVVVRRVTLWRNGFNIDDGPLRSTEDPESRQLLAQVLEGNAPPQLLGVRFGQRVDLKIDKRTNEDYVAPKVSQTFSGSGQRLGAPSPIPATTEANMPGAFGEASSSESERHLDNAQTIFELSDGPRTRITIRFADGSREVVTMNLTHTIADIRNFINFSRRESSTRTYTITSTNTFPPRVLTDETQTIQDAKLERSVVMQKWV
ncbi:SEP-domain-containing protein [Schizopora paradoxa]|uniref:SEP-domain-containing protein n=1 Tax=Schizopora paradoxa TaxID=27342 RepID=A0A0H2RRJ9_9AGAM|nr:SEP-domain-containing protein [Schizopora paradoxa]